jgi:hypothetical protein
VIAESGAVLDCIYRNRRPALRRYGTDDSNRARLPVDNRVDPAGAGASFSGGWRFAFIVVTAGPLLGSRAMRRLRNDPAADRLAGGAK